MILDGELIERAEQAGVSDAEIYAAIETLIEKALARRRKSGRHRRPRLKLRTDPDREHVILLAALVAQKVGLPYQVAARFAEPLATTMTGARSVRERLVRKYRKYFPDGLAPDHPFNALLMPGITLGAGPPLPRPIYSFEELARVQRYS
jgi:hypothetical protein